MAETRGRGSKGKSGEKASDGARKAAAGTPKAGTRKTAGGTRKTAAAARKTAPAKRSSGPAPKAAAAPEAAAPKVPAPKPARPRRTARSRENEKLARSYFDALASRDPKAMGSHWIPEGVGDVVPLAVLRGAVAIESFFRELFDAVPDLETTVRRVVADDSSAAVEWRMVGTFKGIPFQGIEPTGRRIELRGFDLLEIEDGKLAHNTVYYDGMAFARQVGLLPQQDSGAERAMKGALNAYTKMRRAVNQRMSGQL